LYFIHQSSPNTRNIKKASLILHHTTNNNNPFAR
jgi:hypothetical protein